MTERCYKCGRVRITHAPEHDGATGYFEWRDAVKPCPQCGGRGLVRKYKTEPIPVGIYDPMPEYTIYTEACDVCRNPAIVCPECAKEAKE